VLDELKRSMDELSRERKKCGGWGWGQKVIFFFLVHKMLSTKTLTNSFKLTQ